jgi:hypothetical protein
LAAILCHQPYITADFYLSNRKEVFFLQLIKNFYQMVNKDPGIHVEYAIRQFLLAGYRWAHFPVPFFIHKKYFYILTKHQSTASFKAHGGLHAV